MAWSFLASDQGGGLGLNIYLQRACRKFLNCQQPKVEPLAPLVSPLLVSPYPKRQFPLTHFMLSQDTDLLIGTPLSHLTTANSGNVSFTSMYPNEYIFSDLKLPTENISQARTAIQCQVMDLVVAGILPSNGRGKSLVLQIRHKSADIRGLLTPFFTGFEERVSL